MRAAIEAPYRFAEGATSVVDLETWFQLGDLDEDWAVPCATEHADPTRADWIVTWSCTCPPASVVLCTGCKDGVMGAANIVCGDCNTCFVPGSTAIRLIEPLNRRTG